VLQMHCTVRCKLVLWLVYVTPQELSLSRALAGCNLQLPQLRVSQAGLLLIMHTAVQITLQHLLQQSTFWKLQR
jgi:hypothetical protein